MSSNKKSKNQKSRAENDLVAYFVHEEDRFVSFKQLKKKFGNRINKGDLYDAVQHLVDIRFLAEKSNQYRRIGKENFAAAETPHKKTDVIEGVIDITSQGHGYV
ncbi:MAG: hypothetical protein LH473_10485, partial [Chitinophagales bacterium]|nr:hypothetical protein [Chitinophagales bacterium]